MPTEARIEGRDAITVQTALSGVARPRPRGTCGAERMLWRQRGGIGIVEFGDTVFERSRDGSGALATRGEAGRGGGAGIVV